MRRGEARPTGRDTNDRRLSASPLFESHTSIEVMQSVTRSETDDRRLGAPGLVLWGATVWAVVFVSFRLVGHLLLDPTTPLVVAGLFVAVFPLMAFVTYPVYRWAAIPPAKRPRAAALMSLPGLFLDAILVAFAAELLPNMSPENTVLFGSVLLFGYAVVLLTGFVPRRP